MGCQLGCMTLENRWDKHGRPWSQGADSIPPISQHTRHAKNSMPSSQRTGAKRCEAGSHVWLKLTVGSREKAGVGRRTYFLRFGLLIDSSYAGRSAPTRRDEAREGGFSPCIFATRVRPPGSRFLGKVTVSFREYGPESEKVQKVLTRATRVPGCGSHRTQLAASVYTLYSLFA